MNTRRLIFLISASAVGLVGCSSGSGSPIPFFEIGQPPPTNPQNPPTSNQAPSPEAQSAPHNREQPPSPRVASHRSLAEVCDLVCSKAINCDYGECVFGCASFPDDFGVCESIWKEMWECFGDSLVLVCDSAGGFVNDFARCATEKAAFNACLGQAF